jgi:hypothetical protein
MRAIITSIQFCCSHRTISPFRDKEGGACQDRDCFCPYKEKFNNCHNGDIPDGKGYFLYTAEQVPKAPHGKNIDRLKTLRTE